MAEEAGLDLVEIVPNAEPPVCKIVDLGKLKYQNQKKAAEARKKQKTVEIKEIKMRPNIDTHDYEVKMKAALRFFEEGDKVKVTLRFRGREMAHQELGMKLLQRVKEDTVEIAKVESEPKLEGRQMMMVLARAEHFEMPWRSRLRAAFHLPGSRQDRGMTMKTLGELGKYQQRRRLAIGAVVVLLVVALLLSARNRLAISMNISKRSV